MRRIPEPALMDDAEQAHAYADADFAEPHEAFVQRFKDLYPDFHEGDILDLGAGTADVLIRFARVFPESRITGIDGAQSMLDIGLRDVALKGYSQQIKLQKVLLPDNELFLLKFDAVISNSLLHHLTYPIILWETCLQCAKKDAPIFIMDLLRPNSIESAKSLLHQYASDESPILQRDFYQSLLASYSIDEVRLQLKTINLDYLNIDAISDRHMIIWGILK
jgi:SAM-dependent methyltransferase